MAGIDTADSRHHTENQGEDPAERVYMEIMQRDPVDKGQRRIRARLQRQHRA